MGEKAGISGESKGEISVKCEKSRSVAGSNLEEKGAVGIVAKSNGNVVRREMGMGWFLANCIFGSRRHFGHTSWRL